MRYADAEAFRAALEQRLRTRAQQRGVELSRLRKQVVFDRLLARLLALAPERYVLKGGYALDLRLGDRARATQDIDLVVFESIDVVIDDLSTVATDPNADDYFVLAANRTAALEGLEAATAVRFLVQSQLAGRRFEQFHLDVGFGDAPSASPELVVGQDLLAFADVPPLTIPTLPIEQHVAEKLHAYTRTYADGRQSTRVKDLVDLVLILRSMSPSAQALMEAIGATFADRDTQPRPDHLPTPPSGWTAQYVRLAGQVGIDTDLKAGWRASSAFLNPVLGGEVAPEATWSPDDQRWVVR